MIKILVVDCLQPQQELLRRLLASHNQMQIAGTACDCGEALAMIGKLRPNIAVISHQPPQLDSLDVTRCIMESCPIPIIIITGTGSPGDVASTFDAINAGALAVMPRPDSETYPSGGAAGRDLLQTIRVMSEVKVIRRWPKKQPTAIYPAASVAPQTNTLKLVAIGASTGGPLALANLLGGLPKDFIAPVTVVQHMSAGFMRGFVDWLAPSSALPIHIATDGEILRPGHVYMAPDGIHMTVSRNNRITLVSGMDSGIQPSVACLFHSVAQVYGSTAAAVLLTGMGRDGAAELLQLKQKGAVTFAQDKESSVVHGMPGEAIKLGAATYILTPEKIAAALTKLSDMEHIGA